MVTGVCTLCRHADRDTLLRAYLWQTPVRRDRKKREMLYGCVKQHALPNAVSLFYLFIYFFTRNGNMSQGVFFQFSLKMETCDCRYERPIFTFSISTVILKALQSLKVCISSAGFYARLLALNCSFA